MAQLFEPSIDEQIACIDRELSMRGRVYPRQIAAGKMNQKTADREIETMQAIRKSVLRAHGYKAFIHSFLEGLKKKEGGGWTAAMIQKAIDEIDQKIEKQ